MPTYLVVVREERTYRKHVQADSAKAAEEAEWPALEEVTPEEVGFQLWDADIERVTARELYDWEKAK